VEFILGLGLGLSDTLGLGLGLGLESAKERSSALTAIMHENIEKANNVSIKKTTVKFLGILKLNFVFIVIQIVIR
jgi:hypothetical protein